MKQEPFFFKTSNNSWYLYSIAKRRILLVDEFVKDVFERKTKNNNGEICGQKSKVLYSNKRLKEAKRKYDFLLDNGFLDALDVKYLLSKRYTAADVDRCISNSAQLTFELTDRCNLKCTYCAYGEMYDNYDARETGMLNFETAKLIIDYYLSKHNSANNYSYNRNISIGFYGGEPLLNFKLIKEIVEYIKAKKLNNGIVSFSMTTNGLLLEKHIKYLSENQFKILVSLDGDKRSNSYRIKKDGSYSFDQLFRSLQRIRKNNPKYFKKSINFNAVLHNRNDVENIQKFFIKSFNKIPRISQISYNGIAKEKVKDFIKMYKDKYEDSTDLIQLSSCDSDTFISSPIIHLLSDIVFKYSGGVYMFYSDFIDDPSVDKTYYPTGTCIPFSRNIFLTTGGKIVQCERIGHDMAMGRIKNDNLYIDSSFVAKSYNSRFDRLANFCKSCYNIFLCTKCVFQIDEIVSEDGNVCKRHQGKTQFKDSLIELMNSFIAEPILHSRIVNEIRISI